MKLGKLFPFRLGSAQWEQQCWGDRWGCSGRSHGMGLPPRSTPLAPCAHPGTIGENNPTGIYREPRLLLQVAAALAQRGALTFK